MARALGRRFMLQESRLSPAASSSIDPEVSSVFQESALIA